MDRLCDEVMRHWRKQKARNRRQFAREFSKLYAGAREDDINFILKTALNDSANCTELQQIPTSTLDSRAKQCKFLFYLDWNYPKLSPDYKVISSNPALMADSATLIQSSIFLLLSEVPNNYVLHTESPALDQQARLFNHPKCKDLLREYFEVRERWPNSHLSILDEDIEHIFQHRKPAIP